LAPACSFSQPAPAPTSTIAITPVPTDIILPYNLVQENSTACKPPYAALSLISAVDLSEDEITRKLIKEWLNRYKSPAMHPYCRIDDYRIDDIYSDPNAGSLPLEPKGDFMRIVKFSVKLIQVPNDWMSLNGELDQENWLHMSHYVSISKSGDDYVMAFAFP
jgi:hypothetical protein